MFGKYSSLPAIPGEGGLLPVVFDLPRRCTRALRLNREPDGDPKAGECRGVFGFDIGMLISSSPAGGHVLDE